MPQIVLALIALSIAPFAIYLAFRRPLIFPLGLYVMMVPFDPLLGTTTTLTRLVAVITAIVLIFYMVATRRVLAPPKSWTGWALYMLLASMTALWSIAPDSTALVLGQVLQLFFFFTVLSVFPAEAKDVRLLGAIVVASGVMFSIFGLASYASGYRTQEDRLSISLNHLVLDPNHIAAQLLLPIALAVSTMLGTRGIVLRAAALVSTGVMVTTLFLTGSRGGLIALGVLLLYIAWRTRYRLQVLGLMALGGLGSLFTPRIWERFTDKGLQGGSGRVWIWDIGRSAFKHYWLGGAGFGAFPAAYNRELSTVYQQIFQGWNRPAHNALLSAAVELGFFGAVLLVHAWWRSWTDARGNVALEATIVALAVAAWFLDVLFFKYIWLAFEMAVLAKNAAEPRYLRGAPRQTQTVAAALIAPPLRGWRARQRSAPPHSVRETIAPNP